MKTKYKIFLAKIISKLLTIFISKNQIVIRNKIKWDLNLNEAIDLSVYLFGNSESKIFNLKQILSKKDTSLTLIDIGANIGSVSLVMAKMFNKSKIYAIEPTNYAFNKIEKNLKLNHDLADRVFLRQLFITNKRKPEKVWSSWNFDGAKEKHQKHLGIFKEIKKNSYLSLDQFKSNEKIKKVDFIKLDVDGYELEVLNSGIDLFKNDKPVMFIEIAPYLYPEFGYNCKELISFFYKFNYDFYDENLVKIPNMFDKINKIKDGSSKNFFLI